MYPRDKTEFWSRLLGEIIADLPRYYGKDNWDAERLVRTGGRSTKFSSLVSMH